MKQYNMLVTEDQLNAISLASEIAMRLLKSPNSSCEIRLAAAGEAIDKFVCLLSELHEMTQKQLSEIGETSYSIQHRLDS